MLKSEKAITCAVNEVGNLATAFRKAIEQFDTDGSTIIKNDKTWTSKGKQAKTYQTSYGEVTIYRHVYQNYQGGKTYCPLEDEARIVVKSTPHFARMVSSKYALMPSKRDLYDNHGRSITRCTIQNLSEAVGTIVLIVAKVLSCNASFC